MNHAKTRLIAILLFAAAARAESARSGPPERPEDLGPAAIDVSGYPPEHRRVYRDVFLPVYALLEGGPARAINSPLIEADDWRREVLRVKTRPPCCGACPVLSRADAQGLWSFFVYDSLRRKTGPAAAAWAAERRDLIRRFDAAREKKQ